ncbi:phosphomannomutase CpsG [Rheinheimera maricola]|uniref:phosphomannomutase n=1 Tax=Rheinheimera maricola TaxID=2793282 RepID=A0ABS7X3M6_9GAMM|nr:phosphomannomutase CpsG [Rheinheimera maricola]MBZ9610163.1 phosphomannomutase CpsG [Rheinheimera maricola]
MVAIENALRCFKAYDIRGKLDEELTEHLAWCLGRAYALVVQAKTVALGADVRATSEPLKRALALGLLSEGVNVIDLGMTGTEEVYFAAQHLQIDGAIEVTASHNPIDYNGMKLVRHNARPISGDTGLEDIKQQTAALLAEPFPLQQFKQFCQLADSEVAFSWHGAKWQRQSILAAYVDCMLSFIKAAAIKPLKLVVNAGNGAAGHVIDAIEAVFSHAQVPVEFIKLHHQADASFPNGIPNPLLVENRAATSAAVIAHKADFGIAWDGDFDRCFLFDESGHFIEGYYIVGLLAAAFLQKNPGQKIIHDPRLYWNTEHIVRQQGGVSVLSKTGHAFIKERMRLEDAIYGGEMSAHHYFRDFAYCDSGMIPWLLVAELVSVSGQTLSSLVQQMISAYPSSGELNFELSEPKTLMQKVQRHYQAAALLQDFTDGLSMEFTDWRFNLRSSNTENVLRLNVESKADVLLMEQKVAEIISILTEAE